MFWSSRFVDFKLFNHNLRQLLRSSLWKTEALRRPKDYGNLTSGTENVSDRVRHNTYALMHRPGGPSLLCAGQWTEACAMFADLTPSPICRRCGAEFDCLQHRLWNCHLNDVHIDNLCLTHGITRAQLSALPASMKRCGIPSDGTGLTDDQIIAVQDYMVRTAEYAATFGAAHRGALLDCSTRSDWLREE